MKYSPEYITELKPNEVFVFGSNEAGVHGAGAAKLANDKFGAIWGVGVGIQGQSFAIPTKDYWIKTLDLEKIKVYVKSFIEFAKNNKNLNFLVTEIGCGLAGYSSKDVAPLFENIPDNVFLPKNFVDVLQNNVTY